MTLISNAYGFNNRGLKSGSVVRELSETSTCLQHEINHLDGKLIIDHLSKLKRDIIIKKISKVKKNPNRIIV